MIACGLCASSVGRNEDSTQVSGKACSRAESVQGIRQSAQKRADRPRALLLALHSSRSWSLLPRWKARKISARFLHAFHAAYRSALFVISPESAQQSCTLSARFCSGSAGAGHDGAHRLRARFLRAFCAQPPCSIARKKIARNMRAISGISHEAGWANIIYVESR